MTLITCSGLTWGLCAVLSLGYAAEGGSQCERDIIAEQQTYCVMSYLPENNAVDLVKWLILSSASQMTEQSQENPDTSLCEASLNISQNPLCSGKIFIVFVVIDLPFQNPMTFLFRISCC
jgi:hypothetical protein